MEADLARYYHTSIYDYYDGHLSLWQVAARVRYLPPESATRRALGGDGLTHTDYLLYDLVHAQTGQPHPGDPRVARAKAAEDARLREAKARSDERRRRLGITGSVLRKKHTS